ncbi:hypothetical protein [Pseudophaeobacter sp.]|uniref:hypothetical protein n=1 Tax=Pseudophaeobacter sp. TaxID=1971739 RepID=UPI002607FDDD|nr:hypothetical protein [Pseudophaeobacter sp.]
MSDQTNNSSGNGAMAFILGGVVVAVGVLAWVLFAGGATTNQPDISIEVPGVGAVEGTVEGD